MLWIVPARATSTTQTIWLRFVGDAPPVELRLRLETHAGGRTDVAVRPAWQTFTSAADPRQTARVTLEGLAPDTLHHVELVAPAALGGDVAWFRTLPIDVPALGQPPLRIVLGSCFSAQRDRGAGIRRMASHHHAEATPHLKILCGDQVYLDLPFLDSLPIEDGALRRELLARYDANWAPDSDGRFRASGLGELLRRGGNLFVGDDHEFWNNYPFGQAHLPSTWGPLARRKYEGAAKDLYRSYQTDITAEDAKNGLQHFVVGGAASGGEGAGLEVFAIEGRYFRTERRAHHPAALASLVDGLARLSGPALLVLSQPLFEPAADSRAGRKLHDAMLPDFEDFPELVRALATTRHDVLVLSGDIHGGRVVSTAQGRVTEIVSSPLGLLSPGDYHAAPPVSELRAPQQNGAGRLTTLPSSRAEAPLRANNYAVLDLVRRGPSTIEADVSFFQIRADRPPTMKSQRRMSLT